MDIKDVKVGMLVQLNDNSSKEGCVGEVESVDYLDGLVMLRLEGVVTDSVHNEGNIHNRWRIYAGGFEHYQDPEADMVVWDALEVGEHYEDGGECVKLNNQIAFNLSKDIVVQYVTRLSKYHKVKPL